MSTQPCILVVDDDIELCGNICEIIEKGGYKVESVHNGKEAIALSQKNKYDIILVDIELPDITGNKVVREISKTSSSTEFIYITGNATVDSAVEAVKNKQVISYETKPIDIDRFLILLGQITKRKKTEKALKQSEHRFKRYFDLGLIGMATTSLDKNWIEFNDTLCNMFGYLREDFAKLTWTELTHPEDLEFDIAQFNRVLTGEIEGYSIEKRFIHKNGSILYAVISANVLRKADGAVDHFIALVHDITKHKKMEKALMQSEKLKSIGTITAGISHEFNNILAIISGNVQLLKEDYEDHRELTEALCTIKRAVDDGAQISSQMLKFTKTETDAGGLVSSDIRDLIMQSIDFTLPRWRNEAQANGIDYQIDKDGMKSLSAIMCNPSELREVFINIIGNALDAMPEGGRLSFSTWSDDDTVFVGVSDTGEGMSEEVKKYIFDPFFTTKSPVGTGLGMSMAYGIITRHRGKIEVDSEVGNGTTFTLQFPATNEKESLIATPDTEQEINEKNLRILVVDDEESIRNILNQFLSRAGHKVKTVDNGADAIKIIKGEDFDLVLCDLVMSNVSGYDVVKVLNGLKKRPKVGIITGWNKELEPVSGNELKVDFFLKKPFEHSEMAKQIKIAFSMDDKKL